MPDKSHANFDLTAKVRKIVAVVDLYAGNHKVGETEIPVDLEQQARSFSGNVVNIMSPAATAAVEAMTEVFKQQRRRTMNYTFTGPGVGDVVKQMKKNDNPPGATA